MFATAAMACTDFSGSYRDEEQKTYSIKQSRCASVTLTSDEGSASIQADGKFRVTDESDEVKVTTAASFVGTNFTLDSRISYKIEIPPQVPTELIPVKILTIYTKDTSGNLVIQTQVLNSDNDLLGDDTVTNEKI